MTSSNIRRAVAAIVAASCMAIPVSASAQTLPPTFRSDAAQSGGDADHRERGQSRRSVRSDAAADVPERRRAVRRRPARADDRRGRPARAHDRARRRRGVADRAVGHRAAGRARAVRLHAGAHTSRAAARPQSLAPPPTRSSSSRGLRTRAPSIVCGRGIRVEWRGSRSGPARFLVVQPGLLGARNLGQRLGPTQPSRQPPETRKPRDLRGLRSTATGIRTPVSAVRGRRPSPLDDSGRNRRAG